MRPRLRTPIAALLIFGLAATAVFGELFRRGADRTIALSGRPDETTAIVITRRADVTFEAWLVSRNARTLSTRPRRLFDAEHCTPAKNSLALGIPMVSMGLIAIPSWYATRNPVLTYNLTIVAMTLIAAFAMYLLVASWTGVPAAGIAAGLLFGFHPLRLANITHPSVWDASWTVLALWLAERLFARGRWRDAIGLSVAIALQIGASFYPLLAAVFGVPPYLAWLLLRDGLRNVSPGKLALVLATTLAAAAAQFTPYLGAETASGPMRREVFAFASLDLYLPGQPLYPGIAVLGLVAVALLAGRGRLRIAGDPRAPLLIGAVLLALIAAGPTLGQRALPPALAAWVPDLYGFFASFLPGLGAVRGVLRLSQGVHLALAVLAGLGAARLVRGSGRRAPAVALALVALAGFDVLRSPALGLPRTYPWSYETLEPDPEAVAFFDELARRGNTGPLLELPIHRNPNPPVDTERILLTTYHGRRTSACFGSYQSADHDRVADLADRLPDPDAIRALADMGFTTLVLQAHRTRGTLSIRTLAKLERAAAAGRGLTRLHHTPERVAWTLRPELLPAPPPPPGEPR